ncbi:gap junction delta-4 protein-like [Hippoglossus stenolepis]|uniref:gap junction delta-4 protein-like n=1 Tax=Hippoglossus stenolepis TaxID=195615 RepID=UPI001FAEF6B3|nr:gap junction delta-4 protein-like [Hippoglossus stenolepis]
MMGTTDLLFITISHNVSFIGKTWWTLMLLLRMLLVLLAGVSLFSDEQERFVCNTIQPGCSNLCFDAFSPVSVLRLWFFHLVLLCLPHVLFATHVLHRLLSYPHFGGSCSGGSGGGSPENSSSSRELSLHKAPLRDPPRAWGAPRFYCAYFFAVLLRILLEVVFGAGQYFLFGLSVPKSFLCYEAPCTSGVECYVSRPTEKTLMLNFMLGVSSLSVLLSLVDLVSSVKAMVRWRRMREMLMEEMSKGERSSTFTTTTTAEDGDVLPTRRILPSGGSTDADKEEKHAAGVLPNGELLSTKANGGPPRKTSVSTNEKSPENKDTRADMPRSPTPVSNPVPSHFVLHSHLRPPPPPRPDRGPPMGVKNLQGQSSSAETNSSQQSDSSESQDKRAWV